MRASRFRDVRITRRRVLVLNAADLAMVFVGGAGTAALALAVARGDVGWYVTIGFFLLLMAVLVGASVRRGRVVRDDGADFVWLDDEDEL